eukprot:1146184-Pelagomonas_calceolata.AAC.1
MAAHRHKWMQTGTAFIPGKAVHWYMRLPVLSEPVSKELGYRHAMKSAGINHRGSQQSQG